jgi:hypothetical protein
MLQYMCQSWDSQNIKSNAKFHQDTQFSRENIFPYIFKEYFFQNIINN